jgi:hypothetical protein
MSIKEEFKNIKAKTWIKSIWWFILVLGLLYLFSKRYVNIISGDSQPFDIILLLVLLALLLIPLFQEVEIFGVKFKREIEKLRSELATNIISLKNDINNKIDLQNQSNQNFYINPQNIPSDSELSSLKDSFNKVIEEIRQDDKINISPDSEIQSSITKDTQYLFSVRYSIEDELKNIIRRLNINPDTFIFSSMKWMLEIIEAYIKLDRQVVDMLKKVYSICSLAIHAKDVTQAQINFVKDVSPELISYLKNVKKEV